MDYSPWGRKELDVTERLSMTVKTSSVSLETFVTNTDFNNQLTIF